MIDRVLGMGCLRATTQTLIIRTTQRRRTDSQIRCTQCPPRTPTSSTLLLKNLSRMAPTHLPHRCLYSNLQVIIPSIETLLDKARSARSHLAQRNILVPILPKEAPSKKRRNRREFCRNHHQSQIPSIPNDPPLIFPLQALFLSRRAIPHLAEFSEIGDQANPKKEFLILSTFQALLKQHQWQHSNTKTYSLSLPSLPRSERVQ